MAVGRSHTSIVGRVSSAIVRGLESFFYWYGLKLGEQPWKFVGGCMLIVLISSFGMIGFRQEKNPMKLWISPESDFLFDTMYITDKFATGYRLNFLLIKAPDVLEPTVLKEAERLRRNITNINVYNNTWEDVCFRIPVIKKPSSVFDGLGSLFGRKRRSLFMDTIGDDELISGLMFDPTLFLSDSAYCDIVNKLPKGCLEINMGQIWSNSENVIDDLTKTDAIMAVNKTNISPVLGHPTKFSHLLGGVTKDENGKIIAAETLISVWMTVVNFTAVDMEATGNAAGTADWATVENMAWEAEFVRILGEESKKYADSNISIFYEAGRSFGDISSESMFQDIDKIIIGCCIMFVFVQFILPSRYNMVEYRFWMVMVGLFCIFLSFLTAVGVCSLLGVPYGPVHTSLPFLLLGIGVDDVFVIVACWKNLPQSSRKLPIAEQIALTMKHAGVSITVTSVTDLIAFLVGSLTILPSLKSFCIYTAVGIFIMYIFQATIFVAFWTLDERRIRAGRNSVLFCIQHKSFKQTSINEDGMQIRIFDFIYSKIILTVPGKIVVILATITFAGVGIYGDVLLKEMFEPEWFLPNSSYLLQFRNERNKYYPDVGRDAGIYFGKLNYSSEFYNIHRLALELNNEEHILKNVHSWTYGFIKYVKKVNGGNILDQPLGEEQFMKMISQFLWSPNGARFQKNFRFEEQFVCGKAAPPIIMTSIDFTFLNLGPDTRVGAMNNLKQLATNSNITSGDGFVTVWSKLYANWVTDEIIGYELYRNLGMALICVMICTCLLIVDLRVCFWIFLCVVLTLVNVGGFMHFWGLYINVASCIAMVLAVGLCVDFAAHVGHTFLTRTGTRNERALDTIKYIGTAAFNGGVSTLISMSLLVVSDAYIFKTFFKIFLLVVLFGLFHGIVFLPVILSLVGPESYNEPEKGEAAVENGEMVTFKANTTEDEREDDEPDIRR